MIKIQTKLRQNNKEINFVDKDFDSLIKAQRVYNNELESYKTKLILEGGKIMENNKPQEKMFSYANNQYTYKIRFINDLPVSEKRYFGKSPDIDEEKKKEKTVKKKYNKKVKKK